ncbi:MAG: hypothetical protein V3S16_03070 [Candidatus Desulfatibia sp.]|jgi:hypothetical protein|uniref:hypothetical protein n=1 Tax=Candidatus Desulfatibia sp. TaxID=3101189 RepID=UPI002F34BF2E
MIWKNKGKQKTSHLTINGRLEFSRTVFWNENHGTVVPMDILLGIESINHSLGVREICCRETLNNAFVPASENIKRLAQLDISSSVVRQIVEHEGSELSRAQHKSQTGPDFKAEDCTDKTLITGTDGVMVPLVTEEQKLKRRKAQAAKRKKEKRKSTAKASRPRKGSDGTYKEFKVVAFYDKDKTHQYVVGTSGDHKIAGRIMRRVGQKLDISQAQTKYSVSDGASWILKQYNIQLPMLDENILDFYHFREHVTDASYVLFGEGSKEALAWKEEMMEVVKNQGSLVMLGRLAECLKNLRDDDKRQELDNLREYISKRIAMTDYPCFLALGYDIGSGPTESFCGCLTKRLKGSGMRWDKDNAESVMALASIYYSNQWDKYWKSRHKAA